MNAIVAVLTTVGAGIVSGGVYAVVGWIKANSESPQDWSHMRFLKTALAGAFVGGAAAVTGWDLMQVESFGAAIGATVLIDQAAKFLHRRFGPTIKRWLGW